MRGLVSDRGHLVSAPVTAGADRALRKETRKEGENVVLLVVLALLAILFFGLGFAIKWLFILAAVFALIWLISVFAGATGDRTRGAWW